MRSFLTSAEFQVRLNEFTTTTTHRRTLLACPPTQRQQHLVALVSSIQISPCLQHKLRHAKYQLLLKNGTYLRSFCSAACAKMYYAIKGVVIQATFSAAGRSEQSCLPASASIVKVFKMAFYSVKLLSLRSMPTKYGHH